MKPRILVVEDEPGIADTLQYALRTDGFEPSWAASGEDALAQLRAQPPALVVLDVGLPDINGFELFKRLHEIADVPVVFLTARSDEIDRDVGLELCAARPRHRAPHPAPPPTKSRCTSTMAAGRSASTAGCSNSRATNTAC